jgi:hypothetical protein
MILDVNTERGLGELMTEWPKAGGLRFRSCSGRIGREIEANGIDRWLKETNEECAFLCKNTHGSAIKELVKWGFTEESARCWADRSYR